MKYKIQKYFTLLLAIGLLSPSTYALPIDWHGVFAVDTNLIDTYRKIDSNTDNSATNNGSQETALASGASADASFQSYLFILAPTIVVNDAVSIKAEMTNGYGRGGRFGDGNGQSKEASFGNALYQYNVSDSDKSIIMNKFYAELYSDTATYVIGRHSETYALGAVINGGDKTWDRHSFTRDGVTAKLKLGNFYINPFWAKIDSAQSLTKATKIKEIGISLTYDNLDKDVAFGLYYSKKQGSVFNNTVTSEASGTSLALGKTDVKLVDLYFKKSLGDYTFGIEIPLMSGTMGNVFGADNVKLKSKAIIYESSYKINDFWKFGFDAGQVSGEDGNTGSYEAMYLNPNYQIAHLLFRYNMRAVSDNSKNIYDSYITNSRYFKFHVNYEMEKWNWSAAVIYATAEETASTGTAAYNHDRNRTFSATTTQQDDLGIEVDLGFDYAWNSEIIISGAFGYLKSGDYWAYTNNAAITNKPDDSYILQLKTAITF